MSRDRRLAMRYRPPGRDARERVVDPLGLVAKGAAWYLVAHTPDGLRTYRVSRIENARLLDESFDRPPGFDLAVHWRAATEELRKGRHRYEAILRVAPEAAGSFQKWRSATSAIATEEREAEGWVTLTVPFDDEAQAAFVALGLGPNVDVIEPSSLRKRVAAGHAAAVERAGRREAGGPRGGS